MPKPKQISVKDAVFPTTQTLTASSTIAVRAGLAEDLIAVQSDVPVTLTSNPAIQTSNISDRQQITIVNLGLHQITVPTASGGTTRIPSGRAVSLIYSATLASWIALDPSDLVLTQIDLISSANKLRFSNGVTPGTGQAPFYSWANQVVSGSSNYYLLYDFGTFQIPILTVDSGGNVLAVSELFDLTVGGDLIVQGVNIGTAITALQNAAQGAKTLYTTPGSYTLNIPAGATRIRYRVLGGGGGGGGGRADVAGVNRTGGAGGGGGGYSEGETTIAELTATFSAQTSLAIVVGAGGNGGNSVVATSSGGNGVAGGASSIKYGSAASSNLFAQATGGTQGGGGTAATVPGGAVGVGLFSGGTGGQSATGGASVGANSNNPAAGGGGGGGSMNTSNSTQAGAVGGIGDRGNGGTAATGGSNAASGNAGSGASAALPAVAFSGGGGGGGGSAAAGNGGAGGNGTRGGGGGGGGSATGGASGAGGRGGDGAVEVIFF
jgi:hypothetical protein